MNILTKINYYQLKMEVVVKNPPKNLKNCPQKIPKNLKIKQKTNNYFGTLEIKVEHLHF